MVKALNKYPVPQLLEKYSKLRMYSTWRYQQANEGNSGFDTGQVRPSGASHSLQSKMKLSVETKWILNNF